MIDSEWLLKANFKSAIGFFAQALTSFLAKKRFYIFQFLPFFSLIIIHKRQCLAPCLCV